MANEVYVDYQHVLRPQIKGSCRKEDFLKWSRSRDFKGAYKVTREYTKDVKGNLTASEGSSVSDRSSSQEVDDNGAPVTSKPRKSKKVIIDKPDDEERPEDEA